MSAQSRRQELFDQVREIARPIAAYWIFLGLMYAAFSVAVLLEDPSAEGLLILVSFGSITALSVLIGQVMALLRLRDWLVYAYWALMWTVGVAFGIFAAAGSGFIGVMIFIFVLFGPIFTLGGLWSLRVNRAIYATWVPLIYATGTAIVMAESKGKVETWEAGAKWAVWDVFTFSVLGLAIALLLVFLVTRETHRLHQWRRDPAAPLRGSVRESGAARPRLTCLGWLLLGFLAMGLAVGTAAMGPYLWRTGPTDGDGSSEQQGEPGEEQPAEAEEQPGEADEQPGDRLREQADSVSEQVQQDMEQRMERSISVLSTLLLLLVLFLAALLVFWRPARRLLLVRHWQRPLWRQSATERIDNGWRLVELAIADAGVRPRPGEPAERLYHRALPALQKISDSREVHGLLEAARIRDRVAYGLGVRPGEVELMDRVASWAHDTVWERLGERGQIKALYRRL